MIKQAKNLRVGDVIYLPFQKITCLVQFVDTKSDWYDRTMIFFDNFDYAMKTDPNTSIPVIGQTKIN